MAQTVGPVDVKDLSIWVDVADNDTFVAVTCATGATIDFNRSLRRIECKDTAGGLDFKPSTIEWTASIEGLYAMDATLGGVDLADYLLAGDKKEIRYTTDQVGDHYYSGEVYVTSVSLASPGGQGESATYNATLQGVGIPTKTTQA